MPDKLKEKNVNFFVEITISGMKFSGLALLQVTNLKMALFSKGIN